MFARWKENLQALRGVAVLDNSTRSLDHLIELGATACRESLSMCFLKEPKLLEGHNGVTPGDLEIELGCDVSDATFVRGWNLQSARAPQG